MADNEPTISMAGINAPPLYRLVEDGDKTVIVTADTNTPMWVINGKIGGNTVETMTTAERTAITPEAGQLIYDTDEGALYVGDGTTAGGIPVGSGGGGGTPATVTDIMTGSGASKILNVSNIRGSLTAGQAVDVTSQPDNVTGDWKDPFNWTSGYLGFNNSFPKYAAGLTYLLIADLTYDRGTGAGHILISPSGTWLDGTTTAIRIDDGETKRVAMLFASRTGKLTVDAFGAGDVIVVTHLREYEVTACSTEAIAYIAALSNPDAFASYYLVKQDMVQPWTYIIDMETSPAVTIASGLSYKLNAATGTHQLTVDTCPAGYDGRDAIIRIRLGGSGVIQAVAPLQLGGALVPYAINNCVVRFRDGEAVLLVEDTLAGYVVTLTSGTGEGSLAYGLAKADVPYIAFSTSTDGTPVDISGATTAAEDVTVVGNGYEETILTGSITCTSKTIMANLSLSDVQVVGGTMTLGDVFIPSGSTVAVSGGGLAVEKVSGNGGVINLGGKFVSISSGGTSYISGCTVTGGSRTGVGGAFVLTSGNTLVITSAVISGNVATSQGGALFMSAGCSARFENSVVSGNSVRDVYLYGGGRLDIVGGTFGAANNQGLITLNGSTAVYEIAGNGSTTIYSGAIIDLTGNTKAAPISQGKGVAVSGGCTVINSAGASVSIAGGTYTQIKKDGTTA